MLKLRWGADAKARRDSLPQDDLDQLLLALRMLAANPLAGTRLDDRHADMIKMPRGSRFYTAAYRNRSKPKMRYVIYFEDRDYLDIYDIRALKTWNCKLSASSEKCPVDFLLSRANQ